MGAIAAIFQDGTVLPASLGDPGALSNAALASVAVVLAGIAATRMAAAADVIRAERELDPGEAGVAERSAALTLPAALVGTLVVGAAAGALVGADLRAAQELGLGVAIGLIADLVLVRSPILAALARWGGGRVTVQAPVALRRWLPTRRVPGKSATGSAS